MSGFDADRALEAALRAHSAGRLDQAETAYRSILRRSPGHARAAHSLGLVFHQRGRFKEAVEWMRRSVWLDPKAAYFYANLGLALFSAGEAGGAVEALRKGLSLDEASAAAWNNLGLAQRELGALSEAVECHRRAIALDPGSPIMRRNLGAALVEIGESEAGLSELRGAIEMQPGDAGSWNELALALNRCGRHAESEEASRRAVGLDPALPEGFNNLAIALTGLRRLPEAEQAARRALALRPAFPQAFNSLGGALLEAGRAEESVAAFREAVRLRPERGAYRLNLAHALRALNDLSGAESAYREARRRQPGLTEAASQLGDMLLGQGRIDDALAVFRGVAGERPDDPALTAHVLLALNYSDRSAPEEVFAAHREAARRLSASAASGRRPHENDRDPERRLRIGYLSPDLCAHPVAALLSPLLAGHDRERFEVFIYANVARPDEVTARLRGLGHAWHDVKAMSDEQAAALVREHAIDILVDCAGWTRDHRLGLMARRPAPVQATHFGYPNTTGLDEVGYRITDALADPPGMTERLMVERPMRLGRCAWCYEPLLSEGVEPSEPGPDAGGAGGLTFGSINTPAKVTPRAVEAWSEVLGRVPGSRLLMLVRTGGPGAGVFAEGFAARGIGPERLEFVPRASPVEYFRLLRRIDVALDTFPYNGGVTTLDTLWMGVPIVALAGRTHASRVGASMLTSAGLGELVAEDEAAYVRIAAELAAGVSRARGQRRSSHERFRASPLMDGVGYARSVEGAFREAWRAWCAGAGA